MNDLSELFKLSVEERLQLVEDLWDSIAADTQDRPLELSEEEKAELDRRLKEMEDDPASAIRWEDVRAELLARYR
jgi:putative addiction module component (TIGR02574 family)